ncbi:MAG: OB-fold nucleic acid binding domain-containing protein [Lachnospiraceae bacterium]|nr:OB-fold nucleic acid binding domain-containing protein [Lachnospiraceae bacterium]
MILILSMGLMLAGCASPVKVDMKELTGSTMFFLKDNQIEVVSVEGFSEDYYNEEELKNQITAWVGEFNRNGDKVSFKALDVEDGTAKLDLKYKNSEAYEDLNKIRTYYGTLAGAGQKGYDTNLFIGAVSAENPNKILTATAATDMDDVTVIILSQPIAIRTYEKIRFASTNVSIIDRQSAVATEDTSVSHPAVLILE